jgi:chromosome segregation ATPase
MKKIFTVILSLLFFVSIAGNVLLFMQYRGLQNDLLETNQKLEAASSDLDVANKEIKSLKDKNDGLEKKSANLAQQKFDAQEKYHRLEQEYYELYSACEEFIDMYDVQWSLELSFE